MTDMRPSIASAGDLSAQLIECAKRPCVDTYSATLLLHASQTIDRLISGAAQGQSDCGVEAAVTGPDDVPAKWLDQALRSLARELVADPKTPWIGERDPKQHICWTAADRLRGLAYSTPKPGNTADRGAIAQTLLDADYEGCDNHQLADILIEHWDVRWKDASSVPSTNLSPPVFKATQPAESDPVVRPDCAGGETSDREVNGEDYATGSLDVEDALMLPLVFCSALPVTPETRTEWKRITGTDEMTSRVMCDHIRLIHALVKYPLDIDLEKDREKILQLRRVKNE